MGLKFTKFNDFADILDEEIALSKVIIKASNEIGDILTQNDKWKIPQELFEKIVGIRENLVESAKRNNKLTDDLIRIVKQEYFDNNKAA